MKSIIHVFLLVCFYLGACSGSNSIAAGVPPDLPGTSEALPMEKLSKQMYAKLVGESLYISAKMDEQTDIVYWFRKCMFNELYTFNRVGMISNSSNVPTDAPDAIPTTILNSAYSDNIGPFAITGGGWCGGNHPYMDNATATAHNVSFQVLLNGKEAVSDTLVLADSIRIWVVNHIMNPTNPSKEADATTLKEVMSVESVAYNIYQNNIHVTVKQEFKNMRSVNVETYYGMQSMFEGETHTLTANGPYTDWTPQASVGRFVKKDYPNFRRFIEKNAGAYQSSFLLNEGLGNHGEITPDDVVFIGNSSSKTYHRIIAGKTYKAGDDCYWSGLYTWFKAPLADSEDWLCYEGTIGEKEYVFIDCKKAVLSRTLTLPPKYIGRRFSILNKNQYFTINSGNNVTSSGIKLSASVPGSCVIVFN